MPRDFLLIRLQESSSCLFYGSHLHRSLLQEDFISHYPLDSSDRFHEVCAAFLGDIFARSRLVVIGTVGCPDDSSAGTHLLFSVYEKSSFVQLENRCRMWRHPERQGGGSTNSSAAASNRLSWLKNWYICLLSNSISYLWHMSLCYLTRNTFSHLQPKIQLLAPPSHFLCVVSNKLSCFSSRLLLL